MTNVVAEKLANMDTDAQWEITAMCRRDTLNEDEVQQAIKA